MPLLAAAATTLSMYACDEPVVKNSRTEPAPLVRATDQRFEAWRPAPLMPVRFTVSTIACDGAAMTRSAAISPARIVPASAGKRLRSIDAPSESVQDRQLVRPKARRIVKRRIADAA